MKEEEKFMELFKESRNVRPNDAAFNRAFFAVTESREGRFYKRGYSWFLKVSLSLGTLALILGVFVTRQSLDPGTEILAMEIESEEIADTIVMLDYNGTGLIELDNI